MGRFYGAPQEWFRAEDSRPRVRYKPVTRPPSIVNFRLRISPDLMRSRFLLRFVASSLVLLLAAEPVLSAAVPEPHRRSALAVLRTAAEAARPRSPVRLELPAS